jgi:anthranilate phosphoribosyltransferase
MIRSVLSGERRDEARQLVIVNAAAALYVGGSAADLLAGTELAERAINSGAAQAKLEQLAAITHAEGVK